MTWHFSQPLPASLQPLLQEDKLAAIVVHKDTIVACNQAWENLCGYSASEALKKSPQILQGELTDHAKAKRFKHELEEEGNASTTLCNYSKDGTPFVHRIRAIAVRDHLGQDTYYFTVGSAVRDEGIRRAILKRAWTHSAALEKWEVAATAATTALAITSFAVPGWAEETLASLSNPSVVRTLALPSSAQWLTCVAAILVVLTVAISLELAANGIIAPKPTFGETQRSALLGSALLMVCGLGAVALPPTTCLLMAVPCLTATLSRLVLASVQDSSNTEADEAEKEAQEGEEGRGEAEAVRRPAVSPSRSARAEAATKEMSFVSMVLVLALVGVVLAQWLQTPLPSNFVDSPLYLARKQNAEGQASPPVIEECIKTFLGIACYDRFARQSQLSEIILWSHAML